MNEQYEYSLDLQESIFNKCLIQDSKTSSSKEFSYGLINYLKYEFANETDRAKKILEKRIVESLIKKPDLRKKSKPLSLDIGCATCRYPLWLASLGYNAVGYDIDSTAINICKQRAAGNPNITIEKKNILTSPIELAKYSLITCMMGTFNHIPYHKHTTFLNWIYESLEEEGSFILSSWNKQSNYNSYLSFYNKDERKLIENNTRALDSLKNLITKQGFQIQTVKPTILLPNICYETWLPETPIDALISIENSLRNNIDQLNAQLFIIHSTKV